MSATELMRRVVAIYDEQIEKYAYIATSARYLAPRPAGESAIIPATTPEDIAMNILEANAFRRGVEAAKNALIDEHQKLIAPDTIPNELGEETTSGEEPPFYQ